MQELDAGIMTYFNAVKTAGSFYAAIGGRLSNTFAKQTTAYPYAVFFYPVEVPEWRFGDEMQEDIDTQFNLFSNKNSPVEINSLFTKLKARFDNCTLTVSGYRHIYFMRTMAIRLRDEERAVWQYSVSYDVMIEK